MTATLITAVLILGPAVTVTARVHHLTRGPFTYHGGHRT